MAAVLTATPQPELAAVQLEVTGLPAGPVEIVRTDRNGAAVVRQLPAQESIAGALTITDFEPALGGAVTYTVADAAPVTVELGVTSPVLIVPVLPARRASVRALLGNDERRDSPTTVHEIIGRADPIVVSGLMRSPSGELVAWCATYEDATALADVAATGEVILARQGDYSGMDRYLVVLSAQLQAQTEADLVETGIPWVVRMPWQETSAPDSPLMAYAGWTFDDVTAMAGTFAELPGLLGTFTDLAVGP